MKIKTILIAAISAISLLFLLWLTPAVSCNTTKAPASVSDGPGISELNVELLGTKHAYFLHDDGRLADNTAMESPDGEVTLSMISDTTLLNREGEPLTFLQLQVDPNPPDPPADAHIIGIVYDLTPHEATSNPPLMLTLPYRTEDLPEDVQEKDLYIAPYDEENGWGASYYRKVDTENHRVTAQVNTLSKYAILATKELPPPPSLTMSSLVDALSNGRPTIAEFGSSKCVPCKMMKPVLENLAVMFEGELNVVIIEVYEQMSLTREYGVMSIPTQVIFDENGQEIARHIGYWPMEEILAKLEQTGLE